MVSSLQLQRCSVVRPKERRPDVRQQNPFMRGNTIIRSKTFSPGPQSQYICRVTEAHWRWPQHCKTNSLVENVIFADKPQWQRQLDSHQEVSVCQKCLREAQHAHEEGRDRPNTHTFPGPEYRIFMVCIPACFAAWSPPAALRICSHFLAFA